MSLSQAAQPIVRGALAQTPLAEFLVKAYDSALHGTLLLQTQAREKSAIYFLRGAPAKARPANDRTTLSDIAEKLGLISRPVADAALAQARAEDKTCSEVLKAGGHLDQTGLYMALRQQLVEQVLILCHLPDTTGFGFYRANYLAGWGDPGDWRVKPLPMIWRSLVDHLPEVRRNAWLERLGDTPLKIRPESPISRYALSQTEMGVLDMLRAAPLNLEQLTQSGVGSSSTVRKVACALLLSRQLDVGSSKDPVGLHEAPETDKSIPPPEMRAAQRSIQAPRSSALPSGFAANPSQPMQEAPPSAARPAHKSDPRTAHAPPPPRMSNTPPLPSSVELRDAIVAYQQRNPQTHYEVLGLERDANASSIRASFFQLARTWHPDKLPADLADLKPIVTRAFSAMGAAHQTLADSAKRAEYDGALEAAPDEEQAQVAAVLEAASAFQRAEILLKKKNIEGALEQAQAAYEADPLQGDYVALYCWVQGLTRTDKFGDLIALLDRTLKTDSSNIRALWYRAQLLKKANLDAKAIKDFKKIIQLKPDHVEAQRELRVHAIRKRSTPGGSRSSGLFGRFKK